MRRKYRKGAIAVLAAAALTTAAPAGAGLAPGAQGSSYIGKSLAGPRRGRPRKFNRPARAVTLTLPVDVIAALQTVDSDLSRAIVRVVEPVASPGTSPHPARLMAYGTRAVISVPPAGTLKERLGVDLVPLADGRALIAFDADTSIEQLELRVRDALLDPALPGGDRPLFNVLADLLQSSRRRDGLELGQRRIIVLEMNLAGGERAGDPAVGD